MWRQICVEAVGLAACRALRVLRPGVKRHSAFLGAGKRGTTERQGDGTCGEPPRATRSRRTRGPRKPRADGCRRSACLQPPAEGRAPVQPAKTEEQINEACMDGAPWGERETTKKMRQGEARARAREEKGRGWARRRGETTRERFLEEVGERSKVWRQGVERAREERRCQGEERRLQEILPDKGERG